MAKGKVEFTIECTMAAFPERIAEEWEKVFGATVGEPDFYMTMPDPLPKRLPAGVECSTGETRCRATTELVLEKHEKHGYHYTGKWELVAASMGGMKLGLHASATIIDWATVPRQRAREPELPFEEQAELARKAFDEAERALAGVNS